MSQDQNKDVVRRFVDEVLTHGRLERLDELVAPGYVNRAFGVGLEEFKGMLGGLAAALPHRTFDVTDLVAEDDVVVIRYSAEMGDGAGAPHSVRGMTLYRLVDGRIVEDDPITTPDLAQELAALIGPPAAASASPVG